mgnify:CR=1 FL=1
MNQFQELYESKKGTVADALAIISDGDYLVPGYCANEPFTILGQLHTLQDREDIHHIRVLYSLANGDYPFFDKAYEQTFSMDSYFQESLTPSLVFCSSVDWWLLMKTIRNDV